MNNLRTRFERESKKNSYYVQDKIETPVSTIEYVKWLESEYKYLQGGYEKLGEHIRDDNISYPYIHDLEQQIEVLEMKNEELKNEVSKFWIQLLPPHMRKPKP